MGPLRLIERPAGAPPAPPTGARRERAARLEAWTRRLATPRHFEAQAHENVRVGRWIAARFEALGYDVHVQGRYRNVVALPRDREALTLVGAHYDSVPGSAGADDNASGVAVLLDVAGELAARGRPAGVGLVAFNAEEDGFLGSFDFVRAGIPELRLGVRGVHVLEMVGYASDAPGSQARPSGIPLRTPDRGDFLGLLANGGSRRLLQRALDRASTTPDLSVVALQTSFGLERVLPVLNLSDHVPFWRAGLPATLWTDTSFLRNPHYHQASDTPDTLDYLFMARVAELVTASVAP